jgi:hypothetical protein
MADDSDDGKITLAQQIFGMSAAVLGRKPLESKANPAAARDFPSSGLWLAALASHVDDYASRRCCPQS